MKFFNILPVVATAILGVTAAPATRAGLDLGLVTDLLDVVGVALSSIVGGTGLLSDVAVPGALDGPLKGDTILGNIGALVVSLTQANKELDGVQGQTLNDADAAVVVRKLTSVVTLQGQLLNGLVANHNILAQGGQVQPLVGLLGGGLFPNLKGLLAGILGVAPTRNSEISTLIVTVNTGMKAVVAVYGL
ncbi:hypothetical protein BD413DRAFT_30599 [Trametes elegans]|nr:hypothetical protein BD413DRAFT_30599 [Trametes elegans]